MVSNTEQLAARLIEVQEMIGNGEDRQAEIYAEGYAGFGESFSLWAYDEESCRWMARLRKERLELLAALGLTN
jgi:hypothetical protein